MPSLWFSICLNYWNRCFKNISPHLIIFPSLQREHHHTILIHLRNYRPQFVLLRYSASRSAFCVVAETFVLFFFFPKVLLKIKVKQNKRWFLPPICEEIRSKDQLDLKWMVQMNLSTEFHLRIANNLEEHMTCFPRTTSVDVSFLIGTVESFIQLLSSGNVGIGNCQLLRRLENSLVLSSVIFEFLSL